MMYLRHAEVYWRGPGFGWLMGLKFGGKKNDLQGHKLKYFADKTTKATSRFLERYQRPVVDGQPVKWSISKVKVSKFATNHHDAKQMTVCIGLLMQSHRDA